MTRNRTLLAAFASCAFLFSTSVNAKRVCLLYCPLENSLNSCKLTWSPAGDCICSCRGIELDSIASGTSQKSRVRSGLSLSLRSIDGQTITLVPVVPGGPFDGLTVDAKAQEGEGGGTGEKPDKPDASDKEKLTPAEVERLFREILEICRIRKDC